MQHLIRQTIKNSCVGIFFALLSGAAPCDEVAIAKTVTYELATCSAYFSDQSEKITGANISDKTKKQVVEYNKRRALKTFEQAVTVGGKDAAEKAFSAAQKIIKRDEANIFGANLLHDQFSQICAAIAGNIPYWTNITTRGTKFICKPNTKLTNQEQKQILTVRLPHESVLDEAEFTLATINSARNESEFLSDPLRTAMGSYSARTGGAPPRVQLFVILNLSTKAATAEKYRAVHGLLIDKASNLVSTLTIEHEQGGYRFELYDPALGLGSILSGPCEVTSAAASF